MKRLRRLFYRMFVRYRTEVISLPHAQAAALVREDRQWKYCGKFEDRSFAFGMTNVERKERITE